MSLLATSLPVMKIRLYLVSSYDLEKPRLRGVFVWPHTMSGMSQQPKL